MLFKNQSNFSITFLTAKLYASCAKSLHIYFLQGKYLYLYDM